MLDRWIAREHGLVVAGPRPSTLIDPIGPLALQSAVRKLLLRFPASRALRLSFRFSCWNGRR